MIRLENVTKTYQSKSKMQITALNDLTLTFPNKGLVFILGPSGCGKSTLLNLLGGLDAPTKGNIFVNNSPLEFKESSLDEYRNQYIGFIFQDYNLIHNITIMDNLMLTCFEQEKESAKQKVEEVLTQVGLKGYESRYPNELSGGQMQRIAIARALIKNSQIILADEPTGNLNSEMGHEVMEVFKQLASEKLIIVVSHNEELASKYADRIIKMKDGTIILDTHPNLSIEKQNTEQCFKKSKLGNKIIWKMAFKGLLKNKTDSILSILSLLLTFIALMVSFSFLNYNRLDVDVKNIPLMESNYFEIKYDDVDRFDFYDVKPGIIRKKELDLVLQKYPNLTYNINGYVNKANDLKKMGVIFYDNYKEDVEDGIYVSDKSLNLDIQLGKIYYDNQGLNVVKKNSTYNFNQLTGTYLKFENSSNYEKFFEIRGIYYGFDENGGIGVYNTIFYKQDGAYEKEVFEHFSTHSLSVGDGAHLLKVNSQVLPIHEGSHLGISYTTFANYSKFSNILTNNKLICPISDEIKINDDEIYLSIELYNRIFNEKSNVDYYIQEIGFNTYSIKNYPTHIGEKISMDFIYKYYPDYKIKLPPLTLKGVIMDDFFSNYDSEIGLSFTNAYELYKYDKQQMMIIYKESIQNYREFIQYLKDINLRPFYYPQTHFIKDWENDNYTLIKIYSTLFFVFLLLAVFLFLSFIIRTIKRDGKEIGILRSIGIKKNDILKIYLSEIFLISLVILMPTWIVTYLSTNFLNHYFTSMLDYSFYILYYKWWYFFVVLVFIFLINYLSSFVSLIKLMKKKAIDVIRKE